ncbi:unnamed protein product [Parajaminaea phylloscopi]
MKQETSVKALQANSLLHPLRSTLRSWRFSGVQGQSYELSRILSHRQAMVLAAAGPLGTRTSVVIFAPGHRVQA